jgi:ribosomal protein S18 acetylase RimI-like enzyme
MPASKPLFKTKDLIVRPFSDDDLPAVLEVYRQSEDFLSLTPHPIASLEMVKEDAEQAVKEGGLYCVIADRRQIIGVMDFAQQRGGPNTSFLALLMIAKPFRRNHYGEATMKSFEKYLVKNYKSKILKAGVMVNNPLAIKFWERTGFDIDRTPEPRPDGTTIYRMSKNIG